MPALELPRAIATTPNLPGAACIDHREVFDACLERGASHTYRRAICARPSSATPRR